MRHLNMADFCYKFIILYIKHLNKANFCYKFIIFISEFHLGLWHRLGMYTNLDLNGLLLRLYYIFQGSSFWCNWYFLQRWRVWIILHETEEFKRFNKKYIIWTRQQANHIGIHFNHFLLTYEQWTQKISLCTFFQI